MEDKKISEAIKLLYKGAKMLPYHCPDCGIPIFKYQDKMICPSCGREVVFESELESRVRENANKTVKEKTSAESLTSSELEPPKLQELPELPEIQAKSQSKSEVKSSKDLEMEVKESLETETETETKIKIDKKLRNVLELKLNDVLDLLTNARSPDEIERLLDLLERILSMLKGDKNSF
ncbi:MAG: hypothetical protein H0Z28_02550 [Archaeoglobus sp.]|nr:hypothetical protein [Archaeoglobus sp.]